MAQLLTPELPKANRKSPAEVDGEPAKYVYKEIPALPGVFKCKGMVRPESEAFYVNYFLHHTSIHQPCDSDIFLVDSYIGDRVTLDGEEYH